jgi:hypothetical protein
MKFNSLSIAVVCVGLLFSTLAHGQSRIINLPAACANSKVLSELVSEFDETLSLTMTSFRENTKSDPTKNLLLVFINFKTKTWTMAEQVSKDVFCIIATGDDVNPHVKENKNNN